MQIAGTSFRPLEVWRSDVTLDRAYNFASSLAASALRAGCGARVRLAGPRPSQPLVVYERENSPHSRLVREALSELDLDAVIKPCPAGESTHRRELLDVSGKTDVPFLVDRNQRVSIGGAANIVQYLTERYGAQTGPQRLPTGPISLLSSRLATTVRGGELHYTAPKHQPERLLELWNYEASPHCRLVRERLGQLGIGYVSHNLARRSAKREEFKRRFGREQFPYLLDPNTGVGLFESQAIVRYLDESYANRFDAVPAEVGSHPA